MTDIATNLDTIDSSLSDIKTAIVNKGVTPSGNITTYATAIGGITPLNGETVNITPSTSAQTITPTSPKNGITQANVAAVTSSIDANITAENIKKDVTILNVIGTYEGSGGGEFQLTRVKDDNNNEIGTHFMDFTDGNGQKYKIVCLDAQYRLASGAWCSNTSVAVTNLPLYDNLVTSNVWESKETATSNTQKILDFCSANGYTSESATHCRNKIFNINNIQYYGQIPNLIELNGIARNYNIINSMDTSASSNPNTNFNYGRMMWSSNQNDARYTWLQRSSCYVSNETKTLPYFIAPVLEIPY